MSYSMNEINTLALRATRGAGYDWGLAEEAGQATRWLCRHGFNGCGILAGLLSVEAIAQAPLPRRVSDWNWQAQGQDICPLILGSGLVDRAYMLFEGGILTVRGVRAPEMLLPFATWTSRMLHAGVTMEWPGLHMETNGSETAIDAKPGALGLTRVDEVRFWPGGVPTNSLPRYWRVTTDHDAIATLEHLAARTYAPASETSRLLGAGAGLIDND